MSRPRALEKIRVVDFSWVRAGPWATRWLGALGAEVIKIEWPENERGRLPSTTTPQNLEVNLNTSGNFNDTNVNKKSLSLNVRSAKGLEIVKRLIAVSDIVIENFSSRVLQKWGLGYEELCKIKPDIVYVSMSGYGHTGRHHHYTTFGPVAQAVSGLTHLSGLPDQAPAGWGWSPSPPTGPWPRAIREDQRAPAGWPRPRRAGRRNRRRTRARAIGSPGSHRRPARRSGAPLGSRGTPRCRASRTLERSRCERASGPRRSRRRPRRSSRRTRRRARGDATWASRSSGWSRAHPTQRFVRGSPVVGRRVAQPRRAGIDDREPRSSAALAIDSTIVPMWEKPSPTVLPIRYRAWMPSRMIASLYEASIS